MLGYRSGGRFKDSHCLGFQSRVQRSHKASLYLIRTEWVMKLCRRVHMTRYWCEWWIARIDAFVHIVYISEVRQLTNSLSRHKIIWKCKYFKGCVLKFTSTIFPVTIRYLTTDSIIMCATWASTNWLVTPSVKSHYLTSLPDTLLSQRVIPN